MNGSGPADSLPAIVLAASGTARPEGRRVMDRVEAVIRARYPQHEICRAFTSRGVLQDRAEDGHGVWSVPEAIARLGRRGFERIVLQSLHVVPGQEFGQLAHIAASEPGIVVGDPLLAGDADIRATIDAIEPDIWPGIPNVIVAHGSRRPRFNRQLTAFAGLVEAGRDNVLVCTTLGEPGTAPLSEASRQAAVAGAVRFIPLLIAPGRHLANDVLGDAPSAWTNVVGAAEVSCAEPLGANDRVLDVFLAHLARALRDATGC